MFKRIEVQLTEGRSVYLWFTNQKMLDTATAQLDDLIWNGKCAAKIECQDDEECVVQSKHLLGYYIHNFECDLSLVMKINLVQNERQWILQEAVNDAAKVFNAQHEAVKQSMKQ